MYNDAEINQQAVYLCKLPYPAPLGWYDAHRTGMFARVSRKA